MKTITPRHHKAIELYCNPDSDSFGNMLRSYLGAGFKDNKGANHAACRLFADVQISIEVRNKQKEYKEITEQKCSFDDNFIRSQWLQLLDDCKDDTGKIIDRTNANSCLRTMAQHRSMLTDNLNTTTIEQMEELTESQKAMARRIAKLSLAAG